MSKSKLSKALPREPLSPVDLTVLALRESIMMYFKGTCVDRFVDSANVSLMRASFTRPAFQYQRMNLEAEYKHYLLLGSLKLAVLKRCPDSLTLKLPILSRSPQLRDVHRQLSMFMKLYLPHVELHEDGEWNPVTTRDDSELVSQSIIRENRPHEDYELLVNRMLDSYTQNLATPNPAWGEVTFYPQTGVDGSVTLGDPVTVDDFNNLPF